MKSCYRRIECICKKAKLKWIKEGDVNSKFFHHHLNGRRRGHAITKIEKDGSIISKEHVTVRNITSYFEGLFKIFIRYMVVGGFRMASIISRGKYLA